MTAAVHRIASRRDAIAGSGRSRATTPTASLRRSVARSARTWRPSPAGRCRARFQPAVERRTEQMNRCIACSVAPRCRSIAAHAAVTWSAISTGTIAAFITRNPRDIRATRGDAKPRAGTNTTIRPSAQAARNTGCASRHAVSALCDADAAARFAQRSSRVRGHPLSPLTPPYVRFRIRRFTNETANAAVYPAVRPTPWRRSSFSGRQRVHAVLLRSTTGHARRRQICTPAPPRALVDAAS